MRLRNLSVAAAIIELALLAGTRALPALASAGTDQDRTPNNDLTFSGVGTPYNNVQQSHNIKNKPRPPWGVPYWSKGNICRNQGEDIACLTPQAAKKIRWLIPKLSS